MGYFTQILIEAKERYGHVLKERGLVMRGERKDGDLNLIFKSKGAGDWELPVELLVPGKGQTGKARAEWEDVVLTAEIHSAVKIGHTGWIGFAPRHSEQLEYLEGDDMVKFVDGIGSYLKECVLVPTGTLEKRVAPEIASAYFEFTETLGLDDADIAFSTDDNVQTLTVEDGAGQTCSFVWTEKGCRAEVLIDGKSVARMRAPEYPAIQRALLDNFEPRPARKIR